MANPAIFISSICFIADDLPVVFLYYSTESLIFVKQPCISFVFAIGGVLYLLDSAWGFGTEQLGAPQAMLMKMIIEGVMDGNLPWTLVFIGVFLAVAVEIVGIPVLPFAIV